MQKWLAQEFQVSDFKFPWLSSREEEEEEEERMAVWM